ncbi:hypothetical protein [Nocardia sp. bgisy134]|uniref:hypothetical protein n=1 Tax=Nocardia sp. bgisy134 TaxID=3413789 RepID=UPI003D71B471
MSDQGKEYAALVLAELKNEHDRRDLLNTRATSAATGSTAIVTVVLAVVSLLIGKDNPLSSSAKLALVVALSLLLVSAALAISAGLSWRSKSVSIVTMEKMLSTQWKDHEVDARNIVARCNLEAIRTLRQGTATKTQLLISAAATQILALVTLGVTVALTSR